MDAFCSALCRPVWQGADPFWKAFGKLEMLQITGSDAFVKQLLSPNLSPSSVLCLSSQKKARNSCQTDFGFGYAVGWWQRSGSRGAYLEASLIPSRYLWVKSLSTFPRWESIAHSSVSPVWPEQMLSNFPKLILRKWWLPHLDFRGKQKSL